MNVINYHFDLLLAINIYSENFSKTFKNLRLITQTNLFNFNFKRMSNRNRNLKAFK
jgi:hypothetical protein